MSECVSNRVAAIQMVSGHDIDANLAETGQLLAEAANRGAAVAVLPENFAVLATGQMIDCGRREAGSAPVIRKFLA
ncbi:MAG: carbon-nitrogen hydrolase family protein, partial [Marinobacter sp.]|nr:carbon-nitrogen hydrolase family protein [Marinobacter sp.]